MTDEQIRFVGDGEEPEPTPEQASVGQRQVPQDRRSGVLLGREFITAVVMFHEAVGRLLGLTAVERKCLDILAREGPLTAGAIAAHTGLTTGAVTGLIDRLCSGGYIDRESDPKDRRRVLVSLRPNTKMDAIRPLVFGPLGLDMMAITNSYSQPEIEAIADFLRRTTDTLVTNTARLSTLEIPDKETATGMV
jgi:DNA-binding Lrp family transcriptional regulator